jgi:hypothetical protein
VSIASGLQQLRSRSRFQNKKDACAGVLDG